MPVSAYPDQAGLDVLYEVRLQEIRESYVVTTQELAKRWADGVKALLGLVTAVGFLVAPLAVGDLTQVGRSAIGVLLAVTLLAATGALLLMTSAAYGSPRTLPVPQSLEELAIARWDDARRSVRHVRWGRRLAAASLVALAIGIVFSWAVPSTETDARLTVHTEDDVDYCGETLDAPAGMLALSAADEGRVQIPLSRVESIATVEECP